MKTIRTIITLVAVAAIAGIACWWYMSPEADNVKIHNASIK